MNNHRHTPKTTKTIGFRGTVRNVRRENRAAHGAVCHVDTCRCGATRETNSNGRHVERGGWCEVSDGSNWGTDRR